jgi:GNAT superfamily N-acetyltransferase
LNCAFELALASPAHTGACTIIEKSATPIILPRRPITGNFALESNGYCPLSCNEVSIEFTEDTEAINWERLSIVFQRAPLGDRGAVKLREVFQNSPIRCFVWDAGELIGAGRAITDGVRYSVIFDVVLLPEYQGRGIGRQIMNHLADRSKAPSVLLFAVPGREGFYAKLGYRKMKTAMAKFPNPEMQQKSGYIE